jgi:alpha-amylase
VKAGHEPSAEIDVPGQIFRTDSERDGSAWLGNHLQIDAARTLYSLEDRVRATKNRKRIGAWRNLQASDYFHYMNTQGISERAGHRAMNPFASPYDAYIHYMNILKDLSGRIVGKTGVRS